MSRVVFRRSKYLAHFVGWSCLLCAANSHSSRGPAVISAAPADLAEYKTPASAQTTTITTLRQVVPGKMGYLGISVEPAADGRLVVAGIAADSPAAVVGVKTNDILLKADGKPATSPEVFRKIVGARSPGEFVRLDLLRDGQVLDRTAKLGSLASVGRPLERVRLGVQIGATRAEGGVLIDEVDEGSRGARAGLKAGDHILKINGTTVTNAAMVANTVANIPANETVKVTVLRDRKEIEVPVQLAASDGPDRPAPGSRRTTGGRGPVARLDRAVLRLAVIGIEYPDMKHNPRVSVSDWQKAFFSSNSYTGTNATGQRVHGSVNDYFLEQSAGTMRVEGKVFEWLPVSKNRLSYSATPTNRANPGVTEITGERGGFARDGVLLNEVLDKFVAREGRDVLSRYDGVVFLYAGGPAARVQTNVYWPHSASITHQGRRVRYLITTEGGNQMSDISIICHETGHVLGLPDLYIRRERSPSIPIGATNTSAVTLSRPGPFLSRTENPYAESLANWDLMAVHAGAGRPQHLSAWSKEQLGWIKPSLIDPRVRQKLALAPIEKSSNECFKIPLRPDGSEYLLLENRRRIGFDESIPAEGLLIWRVVYGRPVLEEAHGLSGPNAARIDVRRIPFPTDRNDTFTPFTKPGSAAFTGDGLPVYITNIRRLPDGRITFWVGHGYD